MSRVYRRKSGVIYDNHFIDAHLDSRWRYISPSDCYSLNDRASHLRVNRRPDEDSLIMFPVYSNESYTMELVADYTPVADGDYAGLVVWKSDTDKIELLESVDTTQPNTVSRLKVVKDGDTYHFFAMQNNVWELIDTSTFDAVNAGLVAKAAEGEDIVPFDVDRFVIVENETLTFGNCLPNYKVKIMSNDGTYSEERVVPEGQTWVEFTLPYSAFEGTVRLFDESGVLLGEISGTIYGGDEFHFGSFLQVRESSVELDRLAPNDMGIMMGGSILKKYEVYNPSNSLTVSNIELTVMKFDDNYGFQWVDIAWDVSGSPDTFGDVLTHTSLGPNKSKSFWVRVKQDGTIVATNPLYFELDIKHS